MKIDFIGIGAEKAGTTWVANQLDAHPEICMSTPKEIHYFNRKNNYTYDQTLNAHYSKGEKWYAKHWAYCRHGALRGEFSTSYLYDREAPKAIYRTYPDIKLIVCIRNPVERAISAYKWHSEYTRRESRDFSEVIRQETEYIERGMYASQLLRYLKLFDREKLHVIIMDDIRQNPREVIEQLYEFLEVENTFLPKKYKARSNAGRHLKYPELMHGIEIFFGFIDRYRWSSQFRKIIERPWLKNFLLSAMSEKPNSIKIKMEDKLFLAQTFYNDVSELSVILNRDLSHWLEEYLLD